MSARGDKRKRENEEDDVVFKRQMITVDLNDPDSVKNILNLLHFEQKVSESDGELQFPCYGCRPVRLHVMSAWDCAMDDYGEPISEECANIWVSQNPCNTRMCISCWKKQGFTRCTECKTQICAKCASNICTECSESSAKKQSK